MSRELHPDARDVLDELGESGIPPKTALPVEEARRLLDEMLSDRGDPVALGAVRDVSIPGPDESLPVRIYRPEGEAPFPVLVYYHGGAWVRGSIESHDPVCRRLAARAECVVVSVGYRLAPEHPFPQPLEDAYAAAEWVATNGDSIWGDPSRVAVGGDSAGGNLAAATSLLARERDGPELAHQLLLYPTLNYDEEMPSYDENEGYFNTREDREWAQDQYLRSDVDGRNPYAFPLHEPDLAALPSATVLTCEFDMLRDEGQAYAERLREAGVEVEELYYDDLFHAFLNFPEIRPTDAAFDDVAAALGDALGS